MFEIKSGVTRPGPKGVQQAHSTSRYPTEKLEVGQHFVVPKSEMMEGDDGKKFRNRINQSVRTYKQRANNKAHLEADYDEATYKPREYTVLLLGAPTEPDQAWEEGDVGVWRDQ